MNALLLVTTLKGAPLYRLGLEVANPRHFPHIPVCQDPQNQDPPFLRIIGEPELLGHLTPCEKGDGDLPSAASLNLMSKRVPLLFPRGCCGGGTGFAVGHQILLPEGAEYPKPTFRVLEIPYPNADRALPVTGVFALTDVVWELGELEPYDEEACLAARTHTWFRSMQAKMATSAKSFADDHKGELDLDLLVFSAGRTGVAPAIVSGNVAGPETLSF